MKTIFVRWLSFVIVITAFCALAYASVQQAYRQGANDPQIQMAEDAAYALDHGKSIEDVVPSGTIDINRSLAPFYIIFNMEEQPVAASGLLNDSMQTVPDGVLGYAKEKGENRVTWQPQPGTRIAAVIVPYSTGYVLAGRNLREVEVREAQVTFFAGATWVLAVVATLIVIAAGEWLLKGKK